MAVSKRLRFEILRRDNHACRYCGRSAPEVVLRIDHVVPVALGGSDDPSNLVTACEPCNTGKSSASPDATLVADVANDALRWAAAMKQAAEELRPPDRTAVYEALVSTWTSYRRWEIPNDYRETVDQFLNAGLTPEDIVEMARVADAKPNIYKRWPYFCGCCWTRVRQLQERAQEIVAGAAPVTASAATESKLATRWTRSELEEAAQGELQYATKWCDLEEAGCRHQESGHCGDPICMLHYATTLSWIAVTRSNDNWMRYVREESIIGEAEMALD